METPHNPVLSAKHIYTHMSVCKVHVRTHLHTLHLTAKACLRFHMNPFRLLFYDAVFPSRLLLRLIYKRKNLELHVKKISPGLNTAGEEAKGKSTV